MPFGRMGWNPLEVIEQITYLLFIRRLDEMYAAEELKAISDLIGGHTTFNRQFRVGETPLS